MASSAIDRLFDENQRLRQYLQDEGELSHLADVDSQFRKVLLLSAASLFEAQIRQMIIDFVTERSNGDVSIVSFLKTKAIERQYHSYFKWDAKNANQFFGMFGGDFKEYMIARVRADEALATGVKAFLELGDIRNSLVHQEFGTFPLEKTVAEIYSLYREASVFVDSIPASLRNYNE
jgi:hypothetical protein